MQLIYDHKKEIWLQLFEVKFTKHGEIKYLKSKVIGKKDFIEYYKNSLKNISMNLNLTMGPKLPICQRKLHKMINTKPNRMEVTDEKVKLNH